MYWHHYTYQIVNTPSNSQFWGPFWGSFLAFIFGIILFFVTDYIKTKNRIFKKHFNTLVHLERLLNLHIDGIGIARSTANSIIEILGKDALVGSRFDKFKLKDSMSIDLANIDLMNKYFSYSLSVSRFNADFLMINNFLNRFEDALLAKIQIADESKKFLILNIETILKLLDNLETDAKELLVLVRLNLNKIRGHNHMLYSIFRKWCPQFSLEEINNELTILEKEINKEK